LMEHKNEKYFCVLMSILSYEWFVNVPK